MNWLFRSISDRLKALFVTDLALSFESQFVSWQADRKAELLQKAEQLEEEGQHSVAEELRARAESMSLEKPLATVQPSIASLQEDASEPLTAVLEAPATQQAESNGSQKRITATAAGKKKKAARKRK